MRSRVVPLNKMHAVLVSSARVRRLGGQHRIGDSKSPRLPPSLGGVFHLLMCWVMTPQECPREVQAQTA